MCLLQAVIGLHPETPPYEGRARVWIGVRVIYVGIVLRGSGLQ